MQQKIKKHGHSSPKHPLFYMYYIWCSIKQRCTNPNVKNYHRYGGRGVTMCEEWMNDFEAFAKDMGPRPSSRHSIERIDNDKGYCKENCKWATREEQSSNQCYTVFYEYKGEKLSETQWARKLGISRNKMMWWARKKGIEWVIENLELVKKIRRGMSNESYEKTPFKNKRRVTHGANLEGSDLSSTLTCYRGSKWNAQKYGADFVWDTFESFLNDMGKKPEGFRLKRKDKTQKFCKENCYWENQKPPKKHGGNSIN